MKYECDCDKCKQNRSPELILKEEMRQDRNFYLILLFCGFGMGVSVGLIFMDWVGL